MFLEPDPSACGARLLITMPVLFRERRLPYFYDQIRCFAEFMVDSIDVVIITNTFDEARKDLIRNLTRILEPAGITFTIDSFWNESDPKALTWKHKGLILERFLNRKDNYTHFIYVEDDIRLSLLNFNYFVKYRPLLRRFGVIPSFLRYEYSDTRHDLFLTDFATPTCPALDGAIEIDGQQFVTPDYPYTAMYILDREMAIEYIATLSFDMQDSAKRTNWKSAERSAMGLCFENVPNGRTSRLVVPLKLPEMLPYYHCLVHHLPNNYSNGVFPANYPKFGKTSIAKAFVRPKRP